MAASGVLFRDAVTSHLLPSLRALGLRTVATASTAADAPASRTALNSTDGESDLKPRHRARRCRTAVCFPTMQQRAMGARGFATTGLRTMATTDAPAGTKAPAVYTIKTRRTGLLASKKGMMTFFDDWGQQVAVTVLKVRGTAPCREFALTHRTPGGEQPCL